MNKALRVLVVLFVGGLFLAPLALAAPLQVTGGDLTINAPDDTSDGIEFLDAVDRTATVTADKTIGIITGDANDRSVRTSTDDTGIITFEDDATVNGRIGSSGFSLHEVSGGYDGTNVTLSNSVYATTLKVMETGTVTLNGNLHGALTYYGDGLLSLGNNRTISATVTNNTGSDAQGTLVLTGNAIVSGAVGGLGASLFAVNAGADGTTATFSNNVYAAAVNVIGTGIVELEGNLFGDVSYWEDGIVALADSQVITGVVENNSGIDEQGTLVLSGNSAVGGQVGAAGDSLLSVEGGDTGTTATLLGDVYAATVNVTGTGIVELRGNTYGTLSYDADGLVKVADGKTIGSVINNTGTDGNGTLTVLGTSTLANQIGSDGAALRRVNGGANGETATFLSDVYATDVVVTGSGTLVLEDDVHALDLNVAGTGSATLNGNLFGALVYSADGSVIVADNKTITGGISNLTGLDSRGTLTLAGTTTILNPIGGINAFSWQHEYLKAVNAGADGATATFEEGVFASALNVTGTGDVVLNGNVYGTLVFQDDGSATVADGAELLGTVQNESGSDFEGELTLLGTRTTQGTIGVVGDQALRALNLNAGTVTMAHDMAAALIKVDQAGSLVLDADRAVPEGDLELGNTGGGASLTVGTNTLSLGDGRLVTNSGSTINVTATGSDYGRVVQTAGNAGIQSGTNVNMTVVGYIPHETVLKIVDGNAGTGVAPNLTVVDNDLISTFVPNKTAGADLDLTVSTNYDPANYGGGTQAAAAGVAEVDSLGGSADMQMILNTLHHLPTVAAVSSAVQQLRPFEGSSIVAQTEGLANRGPQAAFSHLAAIRESGAPPVIRNRMDLINSSLDEYESSQTGVSSGDRQFFEKALWAKVFGTQAKQGRSGDVAGYRAMGSGIILGLDFLKTDRGAIGVAVGYGKTTVDADQLGIQSSNIQHFPLILYSEYSDGGPWRVDTSISGSVNRYDGKRIIRFDSIDRVATSNYLGRQYDVRVEGSYDIPYPTFTLTPSVSLDYGCLMLPSYSESGAGALNLNVKTQTYDQLKSGVGLAASRSWLKDDLRITPQIYGNTEYDWIASPIKSTVSLDGSSAYFDSPEVASSRQSWDAGMSWEFGLKNMLLKLSYDAEFKRNYWGNYFSAMFKNQF